MTTGKAYTATLRVLADPSIIKSPAEFYDAMSGLLTDMGGEFLLDWGYTSPLVLAGEGRPDDAPAIDIDPDTYGEGEFLTIAEPTR